MTNPLKKDRKKYNLELPKIAAAIQEYKTSCKTQKQCATEFGIPYKVFSYYFINGFKKHMNISNENPNQISNQTYQKKTKQKPNQLNQLIEIIPTQGIQSVQHGGQSTNQNNIMTIPKETTLKRPTEIDIKFNNATTIGKNGKKKIDLGDFL